MVTYFMFPHMLTFLSGGHKANPISSLVKYMVHYCYLEFLCCGAAWESIIFLSSSDLVPSEKIFIPYPSLMLISSKFMHQGSVSTKL